MAAPAEAISQFYTNQQANYRVPEMVQVSYVKYGVSNYLAKAEDEWKKTNFTEVVESNFQRLGTNYVSLGKTPEEARAFMGLPDIAPMQQKMMDEIQARMKAAFDTGDPQAMIKAWSPFGGTTKGPPRPPSWPNTGNRRSTLSPVEASRRRASATAWRANCATLRDWSSDVGGASDISVSGRG